MPAGRLASRRRKAVAATGLYVLISLVMTWPLARVIDSEIAWDMGDPLFNSWVLLWTGGQVLAFLSGDLSALSRFWHGNIFYPERLTVAYSEHLAPQMLQVLPILGATDNVVLAYNLLFLSTFVLSGLGVFLLVRELTGNPVAAFVAGLAFAFAPYRVGQYSHLQVLSAQWMPFALYGFRRFFEHGSRRGLAGGTMALVAQNLSCGYYLLFFAPFVVLYVIYEMAARARLTDWELWRSWMLAGVAAALATIPFLLPYFEVREGTDVGVRTMGEILLFSADTHAIVTPPPALALWGERLTGFPRAEGEGFLGLTIALIALIAIGVIAGRAAASARNGIGLPPWRQVVNGALFVLLALHLLAVVIVLACGTLAVPGPDGWIVFRHVGGWALRSGVLLVLTLLLSPGLRRWLAGRPHSVAGFFILSAGVALVLTWGPDIRVAGQSVGTGPYAWLVAAVPGFDGVRVPARFFMLVALFLAVLVGYALAALSGTRRPHTMLPVAVVAGLLILGESATGAFPTNVRLAAEGYLPTPRDLHVGRALPPIYKHVRDQPDPVVLIEFPFGSHAWDLQAVFYAGQHRRPLVNGFSGFFPEQQRVLRDLFPLIPANPDAAWRGLVGTRATHAVVHDGAYIDSEKGLVDDWLISNGARLLMRDGSDRLYALPQ